MNLVLLYDEDFLIPCSSKEENHPERSSGLPQKVRLTGRRFEHVQDILKVSRGQELTVGKVNGLIGQGKVLELSKDSLTMDVSFKQKPPASLHLTLIMALPRPPMLKRSLQCAASLGVKKIIILNFSRVEKSLWQSSALRPEAIEQELILGLEQAKDTVSPEVVLEKRFKPFVEDQLPALIKDKEAFVFHPTGDSLRLGQLPPMEAVPSFNKVFIIGPEGGLVDFEVDLLKEKGVKAVTLGERILRFENVIPYVIGKMS